MNDPAMKSFAALSRSKGVGPGLERDDLVLVGAAAGVLAVFVAAELLVAGSIGLPLDDSWIHLRFAQNFAAGRGFGINPDEPVGASTAPLWTVLLAGLLALGVPGLVAAKALGVTCYVATGLLTRRLASAIGLESRTALVAGLTVLALARLGWGALSGMEVPLASALVAAGALLAVQRRPLVSAACLGLAALARPEAGVLVPLHALAAGRVRGMLARALVAGVVLLPAVAFNLATVGRPIPATAAAKIEAGLIGHFEGVSGSFSGTGARLEAYLRAWAARLFEDHPALLPLAVAGIAVVRRTPLGPLSWALVLHPIATALVAPYGGPAFQTGRYSSHLLPLCVVTALAALAAIDARLGARPAVRRWRPAIALALAVPLGLSLGPASSKYAWGVQNINAMQVHLGRWVARHTPPEALLAVNDIGAITYFGDRRVIDLVGLATPEILPYRRQGEPGLLQYLERVCPDYLVIFPSWFPELAYRPDLFRVTTGVRLGHREVAGGWTMVVYETVWSRRAVGRAPCPGGAGTGAPVTGAAVGP